jgi:hypothetical protein
VSSAPLAVCLVSASCLSKLLLPPAVLLSEHEHPSPASKTACICTQQEPSTALSQERFFCTSRPYWTASWPSLIIVVFLRVILAARPSANPSWSRLPVLLFTACIAVLSTVCLHPHNQILPCCTTIRVGQRLRLPAALAWFHVQWLRNHVRPNASPRYTLGPGHQSPDLRTCLFVLHLIHGYNADLQ